MVDYNLIADLDLESGFDTELSDIFSDISDDANVDQLINIESDEFKTGSILDGRIVARAGDDFVVDVGLKSEGLISVDEWPGTRQEIYTQCDCSDPG